MLYIIYVILGLKNILQQYNYYVHDQPGPLKLRVQPPPPHFANSMYAHVVCAQYLKFDDPPDLHSHFSTSSLPSILTLCTRFFDLLNIKLIHVTCIAIDFLAWLFS
jgi:hypothetical protein